MKLHLGCGNKKFPGYINVDIIDSEFVDEVADIRFLSGYKEGKSNKSI